MSNSKQQISGCRVSVFRCQGIKVKTLKPEDLKPKPKIFVPPSADYLSVTFRDKRREGNKAKVKPSF